MIEALLFYKNQLILGALMGSAAAALGVFVLLQRMTFFGITLSQAATCAVAAALVLGIHNEAFTLGMTAVLMLPFLALKQRRPHNLEALLAFGLVLFSSSAHMLLSFSGSVQSHLVSAYFGSIVTSDPDEWKHTWAYGVVIIAALVVSYRSLVAVSFDRDHASLSGIKTGRIDLIYFLLLSLILGTAITHMGSFFTLAQLTIPGLFALSLARSVPAAVITAVVYSAVGTLAGFTLSLIPIKIGADEIHLPTSSTIVLLLCAGLVLALFWKRERN